MKFVIDFFNNKAGRFMGNDKIIGHLLAGATILIWGATFVSTKHILDYFSPDEILLYRFAIGLVALILIFPIRMPILGFRQELTLASAGLFGVTLYFLIENIALTYTSASNVGVIICTAPFFTAIISFLLLKDEHLNIMFFIGFSMALIGVSIISFNGQFDLSFNVTGDFLALVATMVWAVYSVLTKKIGQFGINSIQTTRRIFFYGLIFIVPISVIRGDQYNFSRLGELIPLSNILFLGLGASAICFVFWNRAITLIGTIRTSSYIYAVPVVTVVLSNIILGEQLSYVTASGIFLTLLGLFLSEKKFPQMKRKPA